MNKEALSKWVEAECSGDLSYRQLAISLGVSSHAVISWRDKKSKSLATESLQAIALRRKESVAETAKWLGLEPPGGYDIPQMIQAFERRMSAMERKLEYAYQRATQQDEVSNSAVLDTVLLENDVNLRDRRQQIKMRTYVQEIAGNSPGLFERLLLGILGITPLEPADLPAAAELLRRLSNMPWTPAEITRVIREAQVDPD